MWWDTWDWKIKHQKWCMIKFNKASKGERLYKQGGFTICKARKCKWRENIKHERCYQGGIEKR
jgi:hypothetical protein